MTETSWQQNQKHQSTFEDGGEDYDGQSCRMQLKDLRMSEQKLCHCRRPQEGHWAHGGAPSLCCDQNGTRSEKRMRGYSCSGVLLVKTKQFFLTASKEKADSRLDDSFWVGCNHGFVSLAKALREKSWNQKESCRTVNICWSRTSEREEASQCTLATIRWELDQVHMILVGKFSEFKEPFLQVRA